MLGFVYNMSALPDTLYYVATWRRWTAKNHPIARIEYLDTVAFVREFVVPR
jgi:hypothetical protein